MIILSPDGRSGSSGSRSHHYLRNKHAIGCTWE